MLLLLAEIDMAPTRLPSSVVACADAPNNDYPVHTLANRNFVRQASGLPDAE
jgi:hypothetical protein